MVAKEERGEIDRELGISKLLYVEWINHKALPYSTGNSIQYLVVNYNRKEDEEEYIFICVTELLSV